MPNQPAKHGRDHLPSGYAAVVREVSDPSELLDEGSADQIRSVTSTAGSVPWIAVYDNLYYGQTINTSSSGVNLQFPYIDWSDDASGIFSYFRSASTIGASNSYNPTLLRDGVYLFAWDEHADSVGNGTYAVQYNLPINTTPGGTSDNHWKQYVAADGFSLSDYREMGSIMLPVDVGSGVTVVPWITVFRESADADFGITFRNKLWIGYLGPLNNSATFNGSHHNDPYPTTP